MKMLLEQDQNIKTKILNAIMEDPEIVLILKEKYVDEDIWKYCIEREPSLFKKMKHPSESLCMFACEVDGSNLKWIKNKFSYIRITDVMAYTAVKSNPKAILYVPKKFLNDGLKEMAFSKDPSLLAYFDDVREEFIVELLKEKPSAIQYIQHLDEELVCSVLREHPEICVYINNMTDKMLSVLENEYPSYYHLYKNSHMLVE